MPNIVRNDLTIEGENVRLVQDAMGFDSIIQPQNIRVLIDFDCIVPRSPEQPEEGWNEWCAKHWGAMPYDSGQPEDIVELTDKKVSFAFYTRWAPAFLVVETLARQFPNFMFLLRTLDETANVAGDAAWQNGRPTLFLPPFALKLRTGENVPANDPVTPEIRATAARLVQAAADAYEGQAPQKENAEKIVAETIAESGSAVKVEFRQNDDGSACLCVEVENAKSECAET
jgi:hypothetical protein